MNTMNDLRAGAATIGGQWIAANGSQSFSRFPTTVPRSTFDTQPGDQGRPCQVDMFAGHNKFNGQP